jgi:hypothetical protein
MKNSIVATLAGLAAAASVAAPANAQPIQSGQPFRFDAADVVARSTQRFDTVLDLDGDGFDDVIGFYWYTAPLGGVRTTAWYNDGAGALNEAWTVYSATSESSSTKPLAHLRAGDFNGDGLDDFVVTAFQHVWVYASSGVTAPTLIDSFDANEAGSPREVNGLAVGNFGGSPLDDIAVLTKDAEPDVYVYLNPGGGGAFQPSGSFSVYDGVLPPSGIDRELLWAVDVDLDGTSDVMTITGRNVGLYTIENGQLDTSTLFDHQNWMVSDAPMPAFGDVDGDGDDDVVVWHKDGTYTLVRRTGIATWSVEAPVVGGPATDLFDVDGDGDLDGICCGGGGGPGFLHNSAAANFEISMNDGSGVFAPSFRIRSVGSHHIAGATDLDHDGDIDLVGGRCVYYADGPITGPHQPVLAAVPQGPRCVMDMDGDGDPDHSITVDGLMRNDGAGNFAPRASFFPPPPAGYFWMDGGFPGDFDGDGDVDLIATADHASIFVPADGHYFLRNNGGGALFDGGRAAPAGVLLLGAGSGAADPSRTNVLDADDDGDVDLIGDNGLIFWNDGSGYFPDSTAAVGHIQAAVDLGGDGISELISTLAGPGVQAGLGGHQFGTWTQLSGPYLPSTQRHYGLGITDFDLDGDVDVACPKVDIQFHWNDGAGNLGAASVEMDSTMWVASEDGVLLVVDFDEDGRPDIVACPALFSEGTSLVLRNGVAGWELYSFQAVAPLVLADLEGDGDLDAFSDRLELGVEFDDPVADGWSYQYGAGSSIACSGEPLLGAVGPFRAGEVVQIRGTGVNPFSFAWLFIGANQVDFPDLFWAGTSTLVWPPKFLKGFFTAGDPSLPGSGRFTLLYTVKPDVATIGPVYHQAIVYDLCAPETFVTTNGVMIDYE